MRHWELAFLRTTTATIRRDADEEHKEHDPKLPRKIDLRVLMPESAYASVSVSTSAWVTDSRAKLPLWSDVIQSRDFRRTTL